MNESTIGIIGGGIGLLAVIGALWVAAWGMGWFEYLGGKKGSRIVAAISRDELKRKLTALNSPDRPYWLQPAIECDLLVTWNMADVRWEGLFSRERLKKTYRAFLLLDEERRSVRYYEETGSVEWSTAVEGIVPRVSYQSQFFKGRILFQKGWGAGYGVKADGTGAKVFEYKYDIGYVRDPLKKAIIESGWEFVPVARKAHATYRR
jgi:hypothetical protein